MIGVAVFLAFLVLSFPDSLARLFRESPSLNIEVVWESGIDSLLSSSYTVSLGNSIPLKGLMVLFLYG